MFSRQHVIFLFGAVLLANPVEASSLVYILDEAQQFGTVDISTGAFTAIGPGIPIGTFGLAPTPNGSLLTLGFDGTLDRINPITGATTLVGATGLGDCSTATSPCGPNSANAVATLGSRIYATDFQNNLYSLNPSTGQATLIGPTGIPALPWVPLSQNPDGTFNIFDEAFFGYNGMLYATFDTGTVDFNTGTITPVETANLYRIDPATGSTVLIGPTLFSQNALFSLNGGVYSMANETSQTLSINLTNGSTAVVGSFDPALGVICGVAADPATPEPSSFALAGIAAAFLWVRRVRAVGRTRKS